MKTFTSLVVVLLGSLPPSLRSDEPSPLENALRRSIVPPEIPLAEIQDYIEVRVPSMPAVASADEWERHKSRMRRELLDRVVLRGRARGWNDAPGRVEWLETIEGGPGYRIRKVRYEALPGLWIPALLYEPEQLSGKVPVVLNVNGHDGNGKAAPYKQIRCINQAKRGLYALNVEWLGMGQLRGAGYSHSRMNQLDLCGTSGLAPFYLAMKRGIDLLVGLEHADPGRVAVTGLSGGGWQTIIISAIDPRVTLANPVAGYSSYRTRLRHFSDLGDSEQTPVDLATIADYTHLTAMRAPYPTLLTYNAADNCCFAAAHALPPLLEAARPIYHLYGAEGNLVSHINYKPGNHNFDLDNRQAFYRMLGDHFQPEATEFSANEFPSDGEVRSAEQLAVDLPATNETFHSLALSLAGELPLEPELPQTAPAARRWQEARRERLSSVVRAARYEVEAEMSGEHSDGDIAATYWKLRIGASWTVPAVEITSGAASSTALLVAEDGRSSESATAETRRLLAAGARVIAIDPFYFGESSISQRAYLFALLVSAVGDRPLGLQASQVAAAARWAKRRLPVAPLTVVALGPRASLIGLVAAGLETGAIEGARLHGSLGSLREVIERDWGVNERPELFCFGLLAELDSPQLTALVAPRPARFEAPSERVRQELSGLHGFYALLGQGFDPVRSTTGQDGKP